MGKNGLSNGAYQSSRNKKIYKSPNGWLSQNLSFKLKLLITLQMSKPASFSFCNVISSFSLKDSLKENRKTVYSIFLFYRI
jgi:hypothetical protein